MTKQDTKQYISLSMNTAGVEDKVAPVLEFSEAKFALILPPENNVMGTPLLLDKKEAQEALTCLGLAIQQARVNALWPQVGIVKTVDDTHFSVCLIFNVPLENKKELCTAWLHVHKVGPHLVPCIYPKRIDAEIVGGILLDSFSEQTYDWTKATIDQSGIHT